MQRRAAKMKKELADKVRAHRRPLLRASIGRVSVEERSGFYILRMGWIEIHPSGNPVSCSEAITERS
jgi:hypothetical protein